MASCSPNVSPVQKKELFDWKKDDDKKKKATEKPEKYKIPQKRIVSVPVVSVSRSTCVEDVPDEDDLVDCSPSVFICSECDSSSFCVCGESSLQGSAGNDPVLNSLSRKIMGFSYSELLSTESSSQSSLEIQCNIHRKATRGISFVQSALIDSGAMGSFVDREWAKAKGLTMIPLVKAFTMTNADGSVNHAGMVTHKAYFIVEFDGHFESVRADVVTI